MNGQIPNPNEPKNSLEEHPHWLVEAIQLKEDWDLFQQEPEEPILDSFLQRCENAADGARDLARFRQEREKVGFTPLSLKEYLEGLAAGAGVSLDSVLQNFNLSGLSASEKSDAQQLVRLAQELGMSLRETLAHLRIGWLARPGMPAELLLARYRSADKPHRLLDECEAVLIESEKSVDPVSWDEMRRQAEEIKAAWAESEAKDDPR